MGYPYLFAQLDISPNRLRAQITIILFRVMTFLYLLSLVVNFTVLRLYTTNNSIPLPASWVAYILGLLFSLTTVLLAVFFLLWMSRAYKNLVKANIENIRFTHGWAVGAWFVPFVNLVRPLKIVKEIWNKTQEGFRNGQSFERKSDSLIYYWWFAYLLTGILSFNVKQKPTILQIEMNYVFAMISNVVAIFALSYGAKMVKKISAMETEMLDRATQEYEVKVALSAQQYIDISSGNVDQVTRQETVKDAKEDFELLGDFTDNSERAKFVSFGFKLLILIAFLFGGICYFIISEKADTEYYYNWAPVNHWMTPVTLIGFGIFAITGILFMMWMKRAYQNLHHLGIKGLAYNAEGAIYSWFIPLGNLFIPYTILNEINRETQQSVNYEKNTEGNPPNHTLILLFWLTFLLTGLFFLMHLNSQGYTYGDARNSALYGVFSAVTGIISFYLGSVMVKNISVTEQELYALVEEANATEEVEEVVMGPHELNTN
ncbi:MAG: DUF4328 domain-containing protein [Bacteroidota bacterium]|nr:DUF4328 domain-containing protein [Bacteroidota bacterium]